MKYRIWNVCAQKANKHLNKDCWKPQHPPPGTSVSVRAGMPLSCRICLGVHHFDRNQYLSRWIIPSQTPAARRGCWPAEPVRADGQDLDLEDYFQQGLSSCAAALTSPWRSPPASQPLPGQEPALSPCSPYGWATKALPPSLQMSLSQWACLWADLPSSKGS